MNRYAPTITLPDILKEIAFCESGGKHCNPAGSIIRGRIVPEDTGKFQINKTIHSGKAEELGLDLEDEKDNESYAIWLFSIYGITPWKASENCWSK